MGRKSPRIIDKTKKEYKLEKTRKRKVNRLVPETVDSVQRTNRRTECAAVLSRKRFTRINVVAQVLKTPVEVR